MNVVILGGTGFVGRAISRRLNDEPDISLTIAARKPKPVQNTHVIQLDATDPHALAQAVSDFDVLVNCVTGNANTIVTNATSIAACTSADSGPRKIIHMSSMAVYGDKQGLVKEQSSLPSSGNWYAEAKRQAERQLREVEDKGVSLTNLRIGCVFGAESMLWVDRVGLLIRQGRLGDIGVLGDGWSNLVHVDDIASAVIQILRSKKNHSTTYNIVAPDCPRWNDYFRDFALAIECSPLKYKTRYSMLLESYLKAPVFKGLEVLLKPMHLTNSAPMLIPPSLLRLWRQQIKLDCTAIERDLDLLWTDYQTALRDSTRYFRSKYET